MQNTSHCAWHVVSYYYLENTYLVSEAMPFCLGNLGVDCKCPHFYERKSRLREAESSVWGYMC